MENSQAAQRLPGGLPKSPCLHIDLNKTQTFLAASEVHAWAIEYFIETLNVAGPRTSKDPKIHDDVKYIVEGLILLSLVKAQAGETLTDFTHEELMGKVPIPPRTVDEAVDLVMGDLDLKLRVVIAKMDIDELLYAHSNLHTYFKNAFGLWNGNKELIESCRRLSIEPVEDANDATAVLMAVLWNRLRGTHTLRAVK